MGYRVDYGPVKKVRGLEKRVSRKSALTALCFLIFCLLVGTLWPEGAEMLRRLVFPGDPAVTAAALEEFTVQLQTGADVKESLQQFCLNILEGAKVVTVR